MNGNKIYVGDSILRENTGQVRGDIVLIEDEKYYKISNCNRMPPFLMNIVSDSDLWMFISSNGALTAGRRNPDNALFPYYTDDRIHDSGEITGSKTVVFVAKEDKSYLWEPFSACYGGLYNIERSIYKNISGNKIILEEINLDLSVVFRYSWRNCDGFGFIKSSEIKNTGPHPVMINILDGVQNILPYGATRKFQLEYSTLLDAYKKNELIEDIGLGLYTLSSIPTDKAEPNEALRANAVWSAGIENPVVLLSSVQVDNFRKGLPVVTETETHAVRGSYFLQAEFTLQQETEKTWYLVADLNKDHSDIALISSMLRSEQNIKENIENEIIKSTVNLNSMVAAADGLQLTNDQFLSIRHFSNVLFNIMRGGVFEKGYIIEKSDFDLFVSNANRPLRKNYREFFDNLPGLFNFPDNSEKIEKLNDPDFERLYYEYLPLTFSRRHGDPSRPWNIFSIDLRDVKGNKLLNYEGNWRDIFQNWEALSISFPGFVESMIVKFVNSSTADGYNPYIITRNGFDWEVLDPSDTWSYIGYWGDHQIVYLLRLLELSFRYHPGVLNKFLLKEIFTYADVPYKQKPYEEIVEDPRRTIDFDFKLNAGIEERVKKIGSDGKYLQNKDGDILKVNLTEKLLVAVLVKLSNFIPEAGIWMNTQRPEWNDANNALVGFGTSMVTLYYLRSFISFCIRLFTGMEYRQVNISCEVSELLSELNTSMLEFRNLLKGEISDIDRKKVLDKLGKSGSNYRQKIYCTGFSEEKKLISFPEIIIFLRLALEYIDHSVAANKREDGLFHSYNLIRIDGRSGISIRRLYEMLEGQVAVLNSGYLSVEAAMLLINALGKSKLYTEDRSSYLLYPNRHLGKFNEKNTIPKELLNRSRILRNIASQKINDKGIIVEDINGDFHFNSNFRNAEILKQALSESPDSHSRTGEEEKFLLDIYETVFDHQSFTGRSGTFYKYEGLGCIYWHMVSKLLLAVQEIFYRAADAGTDTCKLSELKDCYYEIKNGIGIHNSPDSYGAFPTDPHSHTPANMGAQQPGMTGQVKEDIISRFGELGIVIREGKIKFNPALLNREEFLSKSQMFQYYDVQGIHRTLILFPEMLAYTFCQVPVVYIISNEEKIILTLKDGNEEEMNGHEIGETASRLIFDRKNEIRKIKVLIKK